MADTLDVTDLFFQTCRKFRLSDPNVISQKLTKSTRNRLATSSQLGVTFAVVQDNQVLCFPTKSIIETKLTKENMNIEVKDLAVKTLNFSTVQKINDIGINSDGSLIAILHTTNNNVFVDIHQISALCQTTSLSSFSKIRVGNDPSNEGSAFEWNPAFPDTFAVSSTDRSVMVAKIDLKDGTKQTVIGEKKMGAIATVISWSPKGKQLTLGDKCGKIVQLKPELDIVRCTSTPENMKSLCHITGLCWLATTEWIVSFAKDEKGNDQDTYLMKCKKDKPVEWILLNELSYSNEKSDIPASILTSSQLLVEWNVVLAANTRTSQVIPIGKKQDDWQTWCVPEGKEIYLPATSSDTFPIGITVDRSSSIGASVGFDGNSQSYPAAPVVMILNNDGVLSAFHVISTCHKTCQITSQNMQISNLSPISLSYETPKVSNAPIKVLEVTKKEVKEISPAVPAKTVIPATIPTTTPVTKTVSQTLIQTVPTPPVQHTPAQSTPTEETTAKSTQPDDVHRKKLVEYLTKINEAVKSTSGEIGKLQFASQKTNMAICESSDIIKNSLSDSKNVLNELSNLVKSIEEMTEKSRHAVKDLDFVVDEQMNMVSEAANPENVIGALRDHAEAQKLMKFNKFETSADLLNEKYVQCCELLKKIRYGLMEKEAKRKSILISPLTTGFLSHRLESRAEIETALKVMRNVSKIIVDTKERVQKNEIILARIKKEKKDDIKKEVVDRRNTTIGYVGTSEGCRKSQHLTKEEIVIARQTLLNRYKSKGPVKTRKVDLTKFSNVAPNQSNANNTCDLSTANLTNAILKLSMTPRRQPIHNNKSNTSIVSKTCDATTQADAPPVAVTVKDQPNVAPSVATVKDEPPAVEPVKSAQIPYPILVMKTRAPVVEREEEPRSPPPINSERDFTDAHLEPDLYMHFAPRDKNKPKPTSAFGGLKTDSVIDYTRNNQLANYGNPSYANPPRPTVEYPPRTAPPVNVPSTKVIPKENTETNKKPVSPPPSSLPTTSTSVAPKTGTSTAPSPAPASAPPAIAEVVPAANTTSEVKPEPVVEPAPVVASEKPQEPKKEPVFAFDQPPKTPEQTTETTNQQNTPKTAISFGNASSTTTTNATPKSLFGGSSAATPSSLFGGAVKPATAATSSSPFGMFGQQQNAAPASNPPAQSVGFSFNKPANTSSSFGASIQTTSKPTGFAAAAAAAAVSNDIGMEDDTTNDASFGGGGFMSGLGSSNTNQNSGGNIFASKPAANSSPSTGNSWLFGGGGSGQNKPASTGASFSFANAAAQHAQQPTPQQNSSSMFGGGSKFGGAPSFGSKPSFGGGAAPGGGFLSKDSSIFGGASNNSSAGAGFSQFASSAPKTSSLFGGGTSTPNSGSSSLFGGSSSNNKGSFNSWR